VADSTERGDAPFKRERFERGDVLVYHTEDTSTWFNGAMGVVLKVDKDTEYPYHIKLLSYPESARYKDDYHEGWNGRVWQKIGHIEVPADE